MRQRSLRPGFFLNEDLCGLPPLARLFFAGVWLVADREGRLEDRPARLKAQILPYDDADPDAILASLVEKGFIVRYEVDGNRFISIPKFTQHQHPHPKEPPSVIPKAVERNGKPRIAVVGNEKDMPSKAGSSVPSFPSGSSLEQTSAPSGRAGRETWITPYEQAWIERWGEGSEAPIGEMLKAFGKKHKTDPEELLGRWKRFLSAAETSQWARPVRFIQGWGEWSSDLIRRGPQQRQSSTERTLESVKAFLGKKS